MKITSILTWCANSPKLLCVFFFSFPPCSNCTIPETQLWSHACGCSMYWRSCFNLSSKLKGEILHQCTCTSIIIQLFLQKIRLLFFVQCVACSFSLVIPVAAATVWGGVCVERILILKKSQWKKERGAQIVQQYLGSSFFLFPFTPILYKAGRYCTVVRVFVPIWVFSAAE